MECNNNINDGVDSSEVGRRGQVEPELGAGGPRALRLDVATRVSAAGTVHERLQAMAPEHRSRPHIRRSDLPAPEHPFMNTMDEITYWIYTKRAPCLMNYDSDIKKLYDKAQCSNTVPKSVPSVAEVPSPRKKKKRKLSLLDDDSGSKRQNVYFDTSQNKKQTVRSSCQSDTHGSDIDFNIKISSVEAKVKLPKHLKNGSRTTLHKKNKVVTSTPKVSQLRRSLRQARRSFHNNSHLNSTLDIINANLADCPKQKSIIKELHSPTKDRKSTEFLAGGDQTTQNNKSNIIEESFEHKNGNLNSQLDDMSDVSGLTANYIRSTKLHVNKNRKPRYKNNRSLLKSRQQLSEQRDIVCVNKSVNTPLLNGSMESDNVIHLMTTKSNEKPHKISKSTSLLKFMNLRNSKEGVSNNNNRSKPKVDLNVSFQSNSTSRYPKRYKNNSNNHEILEKPSQTLNQADKRRKISKNSSDFNYSDRKENPEAHSRSTVKTRSGRNLGLTLRPPENTVYVLSNSTEMISSRVDLNVASPEEQPREQKKTLATRHLRPRKAADRHDSLLRDSVRDKSGFTACFSDTDDDSEILKQRKFFCP